MDDLQFIQKFPDEYACRVRYKEQRDKIGILCETVVMQQINRIYFRYRIFDW